MELIISQETQDLSLSEQTMQCASAEVQDIKELQDVKEVKEIYKKEEKEKDQCPELTTLKFKTMMLNGVPLTVSKITTNNIDNLDKFLENEKTTNGNDTWSNLDKTAKIRKLQVFAEMYKEENELCEEECAALMKFLKDALDHKKIQRVKDVVYDKTTGIIKSIPSLSYNKQTSHFTLKNVDKRVSTLKSLPPKKTARGTVKQPH
jgi:hypothetical protein